MEHRPAANGRLFVVHYDDVLRSERPAALRDLIGYEFYRRESDTKVTLPLSLAGTAEQVNAYTRELFRLRQELCAKLKQIKEAVSGQTGQPATTVRTRQALAVFLTEVTPDLRRLRNQVASHLRQEGFRVLPEGQTFYHAPSGFEKTIGRCLEESKLVVQLLGDFRFDPTEDFPHGFERWQFEQAADANRPILRWRSQDLDLDSIDDEDHKQFLNMDDVIACDLHEFSQLVVDKLRRIESQPVLDTTPGGRFVLVKAFREDESLAERLAQALIENGIGYLIDYNGQSLTEMVESDPFRELRFDGFVVTYGACPQDWITKQGLEFRNVLLKCKSDRPVCAVVEGPPLPKPPLRCRPAPLMVIEQDSFVAFVDAVVGREPAA